MKNLAKLNNFILKHFGCSFYPNKLKVAHNKFKKMHIKMPYHKNTF